LPITGSLLEALVGIVKDRPTFKAANLTGSFPVLGQNIINEAPMSARRFFDAGFCFCVLDGPSFYGHFTCLDEW
jgi:cytochrome c oxidase assembly protein Cox11